MSGHSKGFGEEIKILTFEILSLSGALKLEFGITAMHYDLLL